MSPNRGSYGPAADEVGGQFTANEVGGGSMVGTFAGYRSDTVTDPTAPFPTLATVTAPNSLAIIGVTQTLGSYLFKSMTVQPSAGNYVLGLASNHTDPAEMLVLDATTRNAATSTAKFAAYDATFVGGPLTVGLWPEMRHVAGTGRVYRTGPIPISFRFVRQLARTWPRDGLPSQGKRCN